MKFYSSVRIEVRKRAQIKQGDEIIGCRIKIKVVKNKVAAPFRTTEVDIMWNEGISYSGDLIDTGIEYEIVKRSGNSYSYGEEKLGLGREKAKRFLRENPKIANAIDKDIREAAKKKKEEKEEEE